MRRVKQFIQDNTNDFLILDGAIPTLTLGFVKEEMILYNIPSSTYDVILKAFYEFADQKINENTLISELSHGQKLILSLIIALNCMADKIKIRNYFTSINVNKRLLLNEFINTKRKEGKIIVTIED